MSVPGNRITEGSLRAPPGQFRVVKTAKPPGAGDSMPAFFLVQDYTARYDAIQRWRNLTLALRSASEGDVYYRVYDDQGRINDAIGAFITAEDRKAPSGKFRVVCVDFNGKVVIKLVADFDDRAKAIEHAMNADEGPYTGFQVHDDTGAALIPVD